MTEWLQSEIAQIQLVVEAAVVLLGVGVVIATYARTRAIVPTIGAIVFAGVVVWSVHNTAWFSDKVGEEFERGLVVPVADAQGEAA